MKSTKFFIRILAVFLVRVNPASTNANPGCMKNTNMAARSIHTVLIPFTNSSIASGVLSSVVISSATVVAEDAISLIVTVSCAEISVAIQLAIRIAPTMHSLLKLYFLYLSIMFFVYLLYLYSLALRVVCCCRFIFLVQHYRGRCHLFQRYGCGWHLQWG